jgi:Ca2+-binding RTX toxin-like protein
MGVVVYKATGRIAADYYNRDIDYASPAWSPDGSRIAVAGFDSIGSRGRHRRLLGGWEDAWQLDWQPRCSIRGSAASETLRGGAGADVICALAGRDRIVAGARHDVVYGGQGDDVIDGGPGRDWLFGSAGADRILARDGRSDVVDCGPGRDSVVADAVDTLGGDCERVHSRGR